MAKSKSEIKALFETGDKPTESNFGEFIDSTLFIPENVSAGNPLVGIVKVSGEGQVSGIPSGTFGELLLAAETTASGASFFGIPKFSTFGKTWVSADTTALAQVLLGGGLAGIAMYEAATTSETINQLSLSQNLKGAPANTVGVQLLGAETTADAVDILDIAAIVSGATGVVTHSTFGVAIASASNTAAGQLVLGAGAAGVQLFESIVTASALTQLALGAPGVVGLALLQTTTKDAALAEINGVGLGIVLALG